MNKDGYAVTEKIDLFNCHMNLLTGIMSIAHEGYVLCDSYADEPIEGHLCSEGKQGKKFYFEIMNETCSELIFVGDRLLAKIDRGAQ